MINYSCAAVLELFHFLAGGSAMSVYRFASENANAWYSSHLPTSVWELKRLEPIAFSRSHSPPRFLSDLKIPRTYSHRGGGHHETCDQLPSAQIISRTCFDSVRNLVFTCRQGFLYEEASTSGGEGSARCICIRWESVIPQHLKRNAGKYIWDCRNGCRLTDPSLGE